MKDVFGRDLFSQFIGFEDTINTLRKATESATKAMGYPPYNIKQVKDNKYVIEMAVAGFAKSDIELTMEGNKLTIKGVSKDNEDETFLYQGIANRAFERTFTLNDKVEIKDAEMVNGMLKVWLENIVKTQDAIKKIGIKGGE
jgi:molecular chaperone IbpA